MTLWTMSNVTGYQEWWMQFHITLYGFIYMQHEYEEPSVHPRAEFISIPLILRGIILPRLCIILFNALLIKVVFKERMILQKYRMLFISENKGNVLLSSSIIVYDYTPFKRLWSCDLRFFDVCCSEQGLRNGFRYLIGMIFFCIRWFFYKHK